MNTISEETFLTIFEPVLIAIIIGAVFFAFSIHSIVKYHLTGAGICGYLIAMSIMYVGLFNMETALINANIVNTRIYLSELMTVFYVGLLIYIISKTREA